MAASQFEFDAYVLQPSARRLLDSSGNVIGLSGRAYDTLIYLLEHAGRPVSKAELIAALWPDVVVEENNLSQAISQLRRVFGDSPSAPRFIATLPGVGYQWVAETQQSEITPPAASAASAVRPRRRSILWTGALAAVCLIGALSIWWQRSLSSSEPVQVAADVPVVTGPALGVLPFDNLSPDAADAFFAKGLHDEVIHQLAQLRGFAVISRTSMQRYANSQQSVAEIAQELGVTHLLEGSVRYTADQLRVTVQLIDAQEDAQLWSETFTRTRVDLFSIERDLAHSIAQAMHTELIPMRQSSAGRPETQSTQAFVAYLEGLSILRDPTPATSPARSLAFQQALSRALQHDPTMVAAHELKALDHATALAREPARDSPEVFAEHERLAIYHAEQALKLDPNSAVARASQARLAAVAGDAGNAMRLYQEAYALAPRDTNVLIDFATFAFRAGEQDTLRRLSLQLARNDPFAPVLGVMQYLAQSYTLADQSLAATIDRIPLAGRLYSWRALALHQLNRTEQAQRVMRQGRTLERAETTADEHLATSAYVAGLLGLEAEAREDYQVLLERLRTKAIPALVLGFAALGAGEVQAATEHLRRAAADPEERDYQLQFRIKHNIFRDPRLEEPPMLEVRAALGFH